MADQDSTRTLVDIIADIREISAREDDLHRVKIRIAEALTAIDRRLRALEPAPSLARPDLATGALLAEAAANLMNAGSQPRHGPNCNLWAVGRDDGTSDSGWHCGADCPTRQK